MKCISTKSAPKTLPIKDERAVLFRNVLIIGLYNSSPNSLLEIISFLTVPHEFFYQKRFKPLKQVYVISIRFCIFLAKLNSLFRNNLKVVALLFFKKIFRFAQSCNRVESKLYLICFD